MELPELNKEVAEALDASVEISEWIERSHPGEIVQTQMSMVAAPFYGICLEHREAILLLFRHGCRTSAYALFRSVYEALMRGIWAERCLDDQALARIVQTKALPKLETIVSQLDKTSGDKVFATLKRQLYEGMSDYSHGGLLQLERWATADEIASNHPDHEVVQMLRMANLFGMIALCGCVRLAHAPSEQFEARVAEYAAHLSESRLAVTRSRAAPPGLTPP